jgi:transcriptional regulator GlxA family with amidase domain
MGLKYQCQEFKRSVVMKKLAVVLLNGCYSSSASYLLDAVQVANCHIAEAGQDNARIECDVVSLNGRPAQATEGFEFVPNLSVDMAGSQYDLIFVPAVDYPDSTRFLERLASCKALFPWLMRQWQSGAIIASLSTGTFVLAEAGLLDGRLATTPWWLEKQFHRRYPAVKLDITREITESERVVSGSTLGTGAQFSLKLVGMLTSPGIAELTARSVMIVASPCDKTIEAPEPVTETDEIVDRIREFFRKNLDKKINLIEVAGCMQVSERTLIRHFKKKLGITPRAYLHNMRIEFAKRMLRETNLQIGKVAARVGYSDTVFFKKVFRNDVGVSPTVFRSNVQVHQVR